MTHRDHTPKPTRKGVSRPPPPPVTAHAVTPDHTPRSGREGRTEAARLHAEGIPVSEIGRRLGVARETVSRWVNHRAVEAVEAEKEKRAQAFEDSVAPARAKLKGAALRAAEVLVSQLEAGDPAVAASAARTLLDRVGVPRAEVVVSGPEPLDLSGLTDAELEVFERVMRKAGR